MMNDNSRRNYIRRKKYMNDCYDKIRRTLEIINKAAKLGMSEEDVHKNALKHAQAIEAACWKPHLRLSATEYEGITSGKTNELCRAITQKYLPGVQNGKTSFPPMPINVDPSISKINQHEKLSIRIPTSQSMRSIESPQPKGNPPPLFITPRSFVTPPKFPIPMARNRPIRAAFPIPIVPKSAPQPENYLMDYGISEVEKNLPKDSFVPSFEQDVDPFYDSFVESSASFDTNLDDVFNIDDASADPADYLFKF